MKGYYRKLTDQACGGRLPDREKAELAGSIKKRVLLMYAIPLVLIPLYLLFVLQAPIIDFLEDDLHLPDVVILLIVNGPALAGVFALAYGVWFQRKYPKRALSKRLLEMGFRPAVCVMCGYILEGSVSGQYPECGEAIAGQAEGQG